MDHALSRPLGMERGRDGRGEGGGIKSGLQHKSMSLDSSYMICRPVQLRARAGELVLVETPDALSHCSCRNLEYMEGRF